MRYLYGVLVAAVLFGCDLNSFGNRLTDDQNKQGHGFDGGSTGEQDKLQQRAGQYTFLDGTWSYAGQNEAWKASEKEYSFLLEEGKLDISYHEDGYNYVEEHRLQLHPDSISLTPVLKRNRPDPDHSDGWSPRQTAVLPNHYSYAVFLTDDDYVLTIRALSEDYPFDFPKIYWVYITAFFERFSINDYDRFSSTLFFVSDIEASAIAKVDTSQIMPSPISNTDIFDDHSRPKWKYENGGLVLQERPLSSDHQKLLDEKWRFVFFPLQAYFPETYTVNYDETTKTLTLENIDTGETTVLARKEG